MDLAEQLLDTWCIHCRINLYILAAVAAEAFTASAPKMGRSFVQMFAHIHNVRLMWLQSAALGLLAELKKIEKDETVTREELHTALFASGQAVERLLQDVLASGGRVKGFKPHVAAFIGYLVAHESYHHGEIGIVLNEIGFPLDRKTAYGMWEWGVR